MSRRKNYSYVITRLRNSCLIVLFKKNAEAATGGAEAVTGGVLQVRVVLKISQTPRKNTFVGVLIL